MVRKKAIPDKNSRWLNLLAFKTVAHGCHSHSDLENQRISGGYRYADGIYHQLSATNITRSMSSLAAFGYNTMV